LTPGPGSSPPDYDDLPLDPTFGMRHSWGHLDGDIGTLSQVSSAAVLSAVSTVQLGETVTLNLSLDEIDPPLFGRARYEHRIYATERNIFEDELNHWNPQSSSQWDGFRHVRARESGFYGGVTDLEEAGDALGMEHLAAQGIAGRGVLVDVAGWADATGRPHDPLGPTPIDPEMLAATMRHQGVEARAGDILCIRTGWVGAYRGLSAEARGEEQVWRQFTGLRADEDMARHLWNLHPGAVATDNPGFEWAPGSTDDGFLHRRLQPMLGLVMGELLDFETLAARCREIGRYDFLFVAVPLSVPGGLSSPANAMAIL
jgi:kynurenine formamidase